MTEDEVLEQISAGDLSDFLAFMESYWECAMWSTMDSNDIPLENNYSVDYVTYVTEETHNGQLADCVGFWNETRDVIKGDPRRAGHDFWLTRNRHGAGFWDGGWKDEGAFLSETAKRYGEVNLYVSDDGAICS